MVFQQQAIIHQKLDTVARVFDRLPDRLKYAYTRIGQGNTLVRQFLDAVPSGVLFFDSQHILVYANLAAGKVLGDWVLHPSVNSAAALQSHCEFYRAGTGEAYPLSEHPLTKVLQGESAYLPDLILRKEHGPDVPLEIWVDPTIEVQQQRYTVVVCLDVTERRQAEQVLRQQIKLQAEFNNGQRVLEALLPRETPYVPGFELSARCVPASAVGGDFYDWYLNADQNLVLTVGDVVGQYLSAALLMATLRAALRTVGGCAASETLQRATAAIVADFERLGSFATVFQAQLQAAERRLVYASAGHTGGMILRAEGSVTELDMGDLPLGVQSAPVYQAYELSLQPGDRLILYTRGLVHSLPEPSLGVSELAQELWGCATAAALIDRLFQLTDSSETAYDRTVLVLSCTK